MNIKKREYKDYEDYLSHQKSKAPIGSQLHTDLSPGGKCWDSDCEGFKRIFETHRETIANLSKGICLGARTGQEVVILKEIGLEDCIGIDLNPDPPLVIEGDVHDLSFDDDSFDFVFSNIFDHVLYHDKFLDEIFRVCKKDGICILHVDNKYNPETYSASFLEDPAVVTEELTKRGAEILHEGALDIGMPWPDFYEIVFKIS